MTQETSISSDKIRDKYTIHKKNISSFLQKIHETNREELDGLPQFYPAPAPPDFPNSHRIKPIGAVVPGYGRVSLFLTFPRGNSHGGDLSGDKHPNSTVKAHRFFPSLPEKKTSGHSGALNVLDCNMFADIRVSPLREDHMLQKPSSEETFVLGSHSLGPWRSPWRCSGERTHGNLRLKKLDGENFMENPDPKN